jgi:hypothetical protein
VRDEDEECVAVCYSHPFFLQSFIHLFFLINKKRKKTEKKKIGFKIFFCNTRGKKYN